MTARSIILDTRPFVGFLEVIPLGVLEVVPFFSQESPKIRVLMARYASCAQRADACVVRLSELQNKLHPRAQVLYRRCSPAMGPTFAVNDVTGVSEFRSSLRQPAEISAHPPI